MKAQITSRGFSLVEAMVSVAIILIVIVSLVTAMNTYAKLSRSSPGAVKGAYLAEEALEVMRYFRDTSWTSNIAPLPENTPFYLVQNGSTWSTTTTPTLIDNAYDRQIVVSDALRDSASDIVDSGGTADPNTKKVVVTIAWSDGVATTTKTFSSYLAKIYTN